jgi:biopolymer transport protein ExbD
MSRFTGKFRRNKSNISCEIPTGPMADISFLLIIFFMVSTTFIIYRGFPVNLPDALQINSVGGRRNIVGIWVSPEGRIMVDQYEAKVSEINRIVSEKMAGNPRAIIQIKADRDTEFRIISQVIDQLKQCLVTRGL